MGSLDLCCNDVSGFIKAHALDEPAAEKLMSAQFNVAEHVVGHGVGSRVRNPSAYVTKLISGFSRDLEEREDKQQHADHDADEKAAAAEEVAEGHEDHEAQHKECEAEEWPDKEEHEPEHAQ
eukprot:283687-Karenia_brevis.AAC.1